MPTITSFNINPASASIGSPFAISFTVSDSGGPGLQKVVLRRTSGDGSSSDPGWQDIQSQTVSGTASTSGTFDDTPPATGTYWYGMAVFDTAGNSEDERQADLGPKQVTVTSPQPIINLSTASLEFGTLNVGQTLVMSFYIRDPGTADLHVSAITFPPGFSGNWNAGTVAANVST
ncbi:MAG: hypothetical protein KGS61_09245 [Verrucomicrobia bacterium]|nr:hypothetical protein [Verrucomicrobiota bacterium]